MMMEQKHGGIMALNKRLKSSKEEHAEFVKIESVGVDDHQGTEMPVYALAVYEIHGPGSKRIPGEVAIRLGDSQGAGRKANSTSGGSRTSGSRIHPKAMWRRLRCPTTVTATPTDGRTTWQAIKLKFAMKLCVTHSSKGWRSSVDLRCALLTDSGNRSVSGDAMLGFPKCDFHDRKAHVPGVFID